MLKNKRNIIALIAAGTFLGLTACSTTTATQHAAETEDVKWGPCTALAENYAAQAKLFGTPDPIAPVADRLSCATVKVPLDHSAPSGRQVKIAVSKLAPLGDSQGDMFTNPGGPGIEGRSFPAVLAGTALAPLTETHTLYGIDVRGTGGSDAVVCTEPDMTPPEAIDDTWLKEYADAYGASNEACVAQDRELLASMTSATAAHDLDAVREALGLDRVDYFGGSWGTELGAAYSSLHGDHVGRMLLDSVSALSGDATKTLDELAEAYAAHPLPAGPGETPNADAEPSEGTTGEEGADGGTSPEDAPDIDPEELAEQLPDPNETVNFTTRLAYTCNLYGGVGEAGAYREAARARTTAYGLAGDTRIAHPMNTVVSEVSACTGWPIKKAPGVDFVTAEHQLQLVGHASERVTPVAWTLQAHELLGGNLFVAQDAVHASLMSSDKASAAVEYFRSGTPIS